MRIGQEPHVALPTGFPSRQDAKVYFRYSAVAFNNLSFTDSDKTTWRCPQGLKGTFLPSAKNQMSPSNFLKPRVVSSLAWKHRLCLLASRPRLANV